MTTPAPAPPSAAPPATPLAPPPGIAVERLAPTRADAAEVLFCGGFHSSMHGNKARAVAAFCAARGHGCTRFDYRGHGASAGDAERLTLADWLDDALGVLDAIPARAPVLVVGSSMGAWLAVHLAARRPGRVGALALVAAAPDFLNDALAEHLDESGRTRLARGLVARLPTPEDPAGYPITRALLDSGRALALLTEDANAAASVRCPVRLQHGSADDVAPWRRAAALLERLGSADATLELVRGGDHRLSTPTDLERLARTLDELVERTRDTPSTRST